MSDNNINNQRSSRLFFYVCLLSEKIKIVNNDKI